MLRKNLVLFFALIFAFSAFAEDALASRGDLQVAVRFDKNAFEYDDLVMVNVSIANTGKRDVRVLRWFTPFDGVKEDLFEVTLDGKRVEYIGAHYKRPAPTDKDYITIKAGDSIETIVDLSGFYDLSESGLYQVSYNAESFNIFSNKPDSLLAQIDSLKSNGTQAWITGRETKIPVEDAPDNVNGSTSFTSCSSTRQSSLLTARNNAYNYSVNAFNYLNAGNTGPRYTTWFGTYSSTRYSNVRTHYQKIRDAMNNASVRFNCSCTDSAYAYVYPSQPYTIYLCNAFWSAPSTGTDSKAGTLVHEMSHFNVVAATDDWAYGQSACRSLANSNPSRATDNADSHEYFAENTPAQN